MARRELWNETGQWNDAKTPRRAYRYPKLTAKTKGRMARLFYNEPDAADTAMAKREGRALPKRTKGVDHAARAFRSPLGGTAIPSGDKRKMEQRGMVRNNRRS